MRALLQLLIILLMLWGATSQAVMLELGLDDDAQVAIQTFDARGGSLVLWLPSEYGVPATVHRIAGQAAEHGLTVWVADLLSAYYQPSTASGLDGIPPESVAELISRAAERTGKTVYLAAHDRGAALALRGGQVWRERHPDSARLGGIILISPYLLTGTPEVGQGGAYLPVVHGAAEPIFILQPMLSPGRWQLPELLQVLQDVGSQVYVKPLPGVRDRYFFRPDAEASESQMGSRLPKDIEQAVAVLSQTERISTRLSAISPRSEAARSPQERIRGLVPFRGNPEPPPLKLKDLQGRDQTLSEYRGDVILLNFWASWCPPCVHEMPSMQELKTRYADQPFTILAVNMGETRETIEEFLPRVKTDFAILLDQDGAALKRWKVFAFPTSYVIDRQGRIRYALYGAIDWMDQEALRVFDALIVEDVQGRQ